MHNQSSTVLNPDMNPVFDSRIKPEKCHQIIISLIY